MIYSAPDFQKMDSRNRVNLFQSITGPKPAHLIGTTNGEGLHNLAIFSSVSHLGSNPPFFGFISRPETVRRDTLNNIRKSGDFTINSVTKEILESAHQTSGKYPADQCEFEASGLKPHFLEGIESPAVAQSPIRLYMSLQQITPLEMNGTLLVIGKVENVELEDELLAEKGHVDFVQKGMGLSVAGAGSYFSGSFFKELPYIGEPKRF